MPRKREQQMKEVSVSFTRTVKLAEKQCPICGKPFMGQSTKRFCSIACRSKLHYQENAEQFRQARREKYRQQKQQSAQAKG